MRVLIVGGTGMLGHMLLKQWSGHFELAATIRESNADSPLRHLKLATAIYEHVVAEDMGAVEAVLDAFAPQVVVNCIGVVKQIKEAYDPITSTQLNALFPHLLARACRERGSRLLHISTDCVFSGLRGPYSEADVADADDLYGRTKRLGEVVADGACTLRTSIIGPELRRGTGLLEWFLKQQSAAVNGFCNALYSGFPTSVMADILRMVICEQAELSGLWHVSSSPINKFELLCLVRDAYRKDIRINSDSEFHCDRRLDSTRFRDATGFTPAPWADMIERMHAAHTAAN